jgi:glycerol-3-phosphate dehydrogenase subunit B
LLAAHGHPLHCAGSRVNADLQPLAASGSPLFDNLYAAGHILAGFNPLTDGCAEGVALATAYRAIQLIAEETS